VQGLLTGQSAQQVGFENPLDLTTPIVDYLKEDVMADGQSTVAFDSFAGFAIAAQMPPDYFQRLILTHDRSFKPAVRDPWHVRSYRGYKLSYLMVPSTKNIPQDEVANIHPKLYAGEEPGFELVKEFEGDPHWRLYKIVTPNTGELERNQERLSNAKDQD
jgi:hypothetical protein